MESQLVPVLVTTKHRGVFVGLIHPNEIGETTIALEQARMAIYFGTTRGVLELAETGPTKKSRISAPADIPTLTDITMIALITEEAWAKWTA